jgi:hypothetical protein
MDGEFLVKKITRRSLTAAFAALGLALAGVLTAVEASNTPAEAAAGPCSGGLIDTYPVGSVGNIKLYYSSANKGTNCARTNRTSGSGPISMNVFLFLCWQTQPGHLCDIKASSGDRGSYTSYAGPVYVQEAKGRCVVVTGAIGSASGKSSPFVTHCG